MNDLTHVPSGTHIFVDASVLALHFTGHPDLGPPCLNFLERYRLHHLATHDRDFANIPTLHVWYPIPLSS